jgi:hypothetical protein
MILPKALKHARLVVAFLLLEAGCAYGQTSSTGSQTTAGSRFTLQGPAETSLAAPSSRDALGRLCFDVEAMARAHIVDQSIYDHLVSLKNHCSRRLKLKACYFNSDHCNPVDLPPYGRVDTILGTMKGVQFFRYVIR